MHKEPRTVVPEGTTVELHKGDEADIEENRSTAAPGDPAAETPGIRNGSASNTSPHTAITRAARNTLPWKLRPRPTPSRTLLEPNALDHDMLRRVSRLFDT
jgi:hypothetical protein